MELLGAAIILLTAIAYVSVRIAILVAATRRKKRASSRDKNNNK
jgi:hypothetical protein